MEIGARAEEQANAESADKGAEEISNLMQSAYEASDCSQ
jgi:hypothetical protein